MSPEDFRRARNALGLTQRQMGLRTGMQRRTIIRLELGRGSPPTLEQVEAVKAVTQ